MRRTRATSWLFCLALGTGMGCAVTDYGVITDNDQTQGGGTGSNIVSTNGPALHELSSTAATIWADGTDELYSMIDQRANGTAVVTTYNNFSSGTHPTFKSDLYCNPDWQGCAIFTAPDDNDRNLFDGRLNENCTGARSLSILLSTGRYYGECGRTSKVSLEGRLSLIGIGRLRERYGVEGLFYEADRSNLSVTLTNERGESFAAPIIGQFEAWLTTDGGGRATLDITDPLVGTTVGWYAGWVDRHSTEATRVTACYYGICADATIAGRGPVTGGARIRGLRNARF